MFSKYPSLDERGIRLNSYDEESRRKPEPFEEANKMVDDYICFYNHECIQTKTGLTQLALRQSC